MWPNIDPVNDRLYQVEKASASGLGNQTGSKPLGVLYILDEPHRASIKGTMTA